MAAKRISTINRYIGLVADVPTTVPIGSTFLDYNTKLLYITHDGINWTIKDSPAGGKAEDTAHTSGDYGLMFLAVRKDTATALAGTDGDYIPLIVDANGRLHVLDQNSASMLTSLQTIDNMISGNEAQVDVLSTAITKTIQTELLAITAIAANAQQKSSVLALTNMKKMAIFIDHARDSASAFAGAGTEYRIEASQKASGDDTWRTLASVVCAIAAASSVVTDNAEDAGATRIECAAAVPVLGAIMFFKNAAIANSEWSKVVARDTTGGSEYFDILDGLTNAQAAGTYYNGAEQFVLSLDVTAFTRLRVVVNNNNGTTNQAIVSRIAAITQT